MNYHAIKENNMVNGVGVRTVLFVAGCPHHCKGCHNPETWDYNGGKKFGPEEKELIFKTMENPYIDGLTISGGDPLCPTNAYSVYALCKDLKEKYPEKTIWVYTGYTFETILERFPDIIPWIDVLVDGKFELELKDANYPFAGSTNQRVIDIQESMCTDPLETKNTVVLFDRWKYLTNKK